jgi:hypothetical protein
MKNKTTGRMGNSVSNNTLVLSSKQMEVSHKRAQSLLLSICCIYRAPAMCKVLVTEPTYLAAVQGSVDSLLRSAATYTQEFHFTKA